METNENYELTIEYENLKNYLLSTNTEAFEMIEEYVLGATKSQLKAINLELLEARKNARERIAELMSIKAENTDELKENTDD